MCSVCSVRVVCACVRGFPHVCIYHTVYTISMYIVCVCVCVVLLAQELYRCDKLYYR